MSEQRTVGFRAPVQQAVLDDPRTLAMLMDRLVQGAHIELNKVFEGRNYSTREVRLVVSGGGPSFIRDLFDAEIRITVELAD